MKQLRKSTGVFLYVTKQTKTTTSAPIDTPVDTTVDPHEFDCGLKPLPDNLMTTICLICCGKCVHNSCIKPKVFQSMKKKKIQNLILQWKILRLLTEKVWEKVRFVIVRTQSTIPMSNWKY
jgi:hypothetical protein